MRVRVKDYYYPPRSYKAIEDVQPFRRSGVQPFLSGSSGAIKLQSHHLDHVFYSQIMNAVIKNTILQSIFVCRISSFRSTSKPSRDVGWCVYQEQHLLAGVPSPGSSLVGFPLLPTLVFVNLATCVSPCTDKHLLQPSPLLRE